MASFFWEDNNSIKEITNDLHVLVWLVTYNMKHRQHAVKLSNDLTL